MNLGHVQNERLILTRQNPLQQYTIHIEFNSYRTLKARFVNSRTPLVLFSSSSSLVSRDTEITSFNYRPSMIIGCYKWAGHCCDQHWVDFARAKRFPARKNCDEKIGPITSEIRVSLGIMNGQPWPVQLKKESHLKWLRTMTPIFGLTTQWLY